MLDARGQRTDDRLDTADNSLAIIWRCMCTEIWPDVLPESLITRRHPYSQSSSQVYFESSAKSDGSTIVYLSELANLILLKV